MATQRYVLLIDDDPDDKDIFNSALRAISPNDILHYSPSGPDALKHLADGSYRPGHIFLDLNMTPLNGIETLREIKKMANCTEIPVIIYSTTITEDIIYKTLKLGAFDHFQKPYSQRDLETYLKRVLLIT